VDNAIRIADDLPSDARELVDKASKEIGKIQDQQRKQVAQLQAKFDAEVAHLNEQAEAKIQSKVEKLATALKPLQVAYAREGLLDEALAIRDQIKQLASAGSDVQPDPGTMYNFAGEVGKTFAFEVTGMAGSSIWGTDTYTSDSPLATAAVHAGKVSVGERKVIRVTVVAPPPSFSGTTRNGVTSGSYGSYPGAYKIL